MPQDRSIATRFDLKSMSTFESTRGQETKEDSLRGDVLLDGVADWPMPAFRADSQRLVESHRRPTLGRPQVIFGGGQRIDQSPDRTGVRIVYALMKVMDLHNLKTPFSDSRRKEDHSIFQA